MAKAKKRVGKRRAKTGRKPVAKRRPASAPAPAARPIVIPGAWPFPMGSKS